MFCTFSRDERRDDRWSVSSEHMIAGASEETKAKKEKKSVLFDSICSPFYYYIMLFPISCI